jgi:Zn-dependent protease with chaperone function
MPLRRLISTTLAILMLGTATPLPAGAMSTASEVQAGKDEDKDIVAQSGVVSDPLLNAWVNDVSQKLWAQVARKDVPYNIKILDSSDINAFNTLGGYIYIYEGTLDFVQSDDELAAVIGHETGHNERRHGVTFQSKVQLSNIVFGVASIFSPFFYNFGQIFQAGYLAKEERMQELQADQYGLLLMSRAGFDPDADVTFMQHLGALHAEHDSAVDKYFADHPGVPDRVAHLVGYDELDPKKRTNDQILVQAIHDQDTGRYSVAALKFNDVLKADPGNTIALLHLGQTQIALGQTQKSEQTLAEAAAKGNPETRAAALTGISSLRESQAHFDVFKPNLAMLRASLDDAKTREAQADAAITTRRDSGKDQVKALTNRLESISYGIPDFSRVQVRKGGRLEAVLKNINAMGRSIDTAYSKSSESIGGIGSLEKNKESGLLKENADILKELAAPLELDPVPPQMLSVFPSYPRMLDDLSTADGDMIRSLDAGRSALAMLDVGLGDLDAFIKKLAQTRLDFGGDISQGDYNALLPLMQTSSDSLAKSAVAGAQSAQLFNLARARQLQTRITMLGLAYPENRYATLQHALDLRVKNSGLDYTTMEHEDLTPGEVAAASIIAADTNTTPEAVVQEAKLSHRRIVDIANARGMQSEALEIFLGLVYLDYMDDPVKEAKGHGA